MNIQKGITPIAIVIVLALLAGGGYVVVKTNPGLAQKLGFEKVENKEAIVDQTGETEAKKGETENWKTYKNTSFGFEVRYPANYFVLDYGVTPQNTTFTAAVLAIADSEKTYQSGGAKIVVYVSSLPVAAFKDSEEYLKYMRASYPSLKNVTVTKVDTVNLGGTEGIQFFGSQKDSAGKVENIQSILGYSNKTGYEVTAYSSEHSLFSTILSTFKFTTPDTTATGDWKTYRDAHVNVAYEFKGPAALKTGKVGEGGGVVYDTEDDTYLFIVSCGYPNPDRTLAELRKEPEIAYIDNYPARVSEGALTNTEGYSYQYLSKVFFTPQHTCDISMLLKNSSDNKVLRPTFDNILSTFTFTK